mmetsp:Transcript_2126/g.4389  ORF Transcript_2126/g.4389 Transcript_2126/m.4389 type:complete len:86 (-) Transcript_2126:293-550(-)
MRSHGACSLQATMSSLSHGEAAPLEGGDMADTSLRPNIACAAGSKASPDEPIGGVGAGSSDDWSCNSSLVNRAETRETEPSEVVR